MPSTVELDQSVPVVGEVAETAPCICADELLTGDCVHLVDVVRQACTETGFFYIDLTSSQSNAIAATLFQLKRFLSLGDHDPRKQKARQSDCDYGWVPKYKATGHRVRKTAEQRFSIVLFVAANEHIKIAPQSRFVSADVSSTYAPITQAQHIENEVRRAKQNAADLTGPGVQRRE